VKEISLIKKQGVIRLFFSGLSYGEIAQQVGIAQGSVANVVGEFRAGKLAIPTTLGQYMDELRRVAVDMKKHNTGVQQLEMYVSLHNKLGEMGVGINTVSSWLDICQDIATDTVSNSQFVVAALHLAQLEAETGHNPKSLTDEFKTTFDELKGLKAEVDKTAKEKEKGAKELDSTHEAVKAAQKAFAAQTKHLKSKLDDFMVHNQLSWDKANTVLAILDGGLAKQGLSQEGKEAISKEIAKVGSLYILGKDLRKKTDELAKKCQDLVKQNGILDGLNSFSTETYNQLVPAVMAKFKEQKEVEKTLETMASDVAKLKEAKSAHALDIYSAWLVLELVLSPECLSNDDLDRLVELMIGVRQVRSGAGPKKCVDASGKVVCECKVPVHSTPLEGYGIMMSNARTRLAQYILPLVEDKYVPRFQYDIAEVTREMNDMTCILLDVASGHPGAPDNTKGSQ
jgi:hypothetical protein